MLSLSKQEETSKTVITIVHKAQKSQEYVWSPQPFERVLFLSVRPDGSQAWRVGYYVGLHNDLRNLRSADDTRSGKHFEGSPIHNETDEDGNAIIRALVWDAVEFIGMNNRREWADIGYILEHTRANVEIAHEHNRLFREAVSAEMLEAFGEVEAVA